MFVAHARTRVLDRRASFLEGTAGALPLGPGSVDVAVAGLVLNFVPDLSAGLTELRRVVVPGGTIAGYVWDYAGRMEIIRRFFDAAIELDPAAEAADEGLRFSICAPGPLRAALRIPSRRRLAVFRSAMLRGGNSTASAALARAARASGALISSRLHGLAIR